MKHIPQFLKYGVLFLIVGFLASCSIFLNAVDYNNTLVDIYDNAYIEDDFFTYFQEVEISYVDNMRERASEFDATLVSAIAEMEKIGDFRGDASLKDVLIADLDVTREVLAGEYTQAFAIFDEMNELTEADTWTDQLEDEYYDKQVELYDQIDVKFTAASDEVDRVQSLFAIEHGFEMDVEFE